jgi:hypothetical protein
MSDATDIAEASSRPPRFWSIVSVVVVLVTVVGGFVFTDDAWPFAPFRMFSVGNDPNGVVRRMALVGDTSLGPVHFGATSLGLRRAELEEQTPWNRRVPAARLDDLAAAYNDRHRVPLIHLQVVVYTTQMHDGEKASGETSVVIGDWAASSYSGPRVSVDLPVAPPWPGYNR